MWGMMSRVKIFFASILKGGGLLLFNKTSYIHSNENMSLHYCINLSTLRIASWINFNPANYSSRVNSSILFFYVCKRAIYRDITTI